MKHSQTQMSKTFFFIALNASKQFIYLRKKVIFLYLHICLPYIWKAEYQLLFDSIKGDMKQV